MQKKQAKVSRSNSSLQSENITHSLTVRQEGKEGGENMMFV